MFSNQRVLRLSIIVLLAVSVFLWAVYAWLFPRGKTRDVPLKDTSLAQMYDLVVVGSDPEGVAAAVSGARNGLRTLLVDTRPVLGGLMTLGWLNTIDMNYDIDGEILNRGIFLELFQNLEGDSFDVRTAEAELNALVNAEALLDVMLKAVKIEPLLTDKSGHVRADGIAIDTPEGRKHNVGAARIIDATQDADIAAAAGVPFTTGQEDLGRPERQMAVTLVFRLTGIDNLDWLRMRLALLIDRKAGNLETGSNRVTAWGFNRMAREYQPESERVAVRALNMGRQNDGSVLINALQVFGVDPLDPVSLEEARNIAEKELPGLIRHLNKHVPGFSRAELAGTAPELYVRESRHIMGMYRLGINDVMENRCFGDYIAFGSYPVDIQATGPDEAGTVIGKPDRFSVPFRSIVPHGVDNLLVVGRSASFDSLAHGSARVIPVGMAAGEAAGAAAAISIEGGHSFHQVSRSNEFTGLLHERLNNQGMSLQSYTLSFPCRDHWAYAGLRFMRELGLAHGGYTNDYKLEDEISEQQFINILNWSVRQKKANVKQAPWTYAGDRELTLEDAAGIMSGYLGVKLTPGDALRYLEAEGFLEEEVLARVREQDYISIGAGYMIIKEFIERAGQSAPDY